MKIYTYLDIDNNPILIGILYVENNGFESYSFEYDNKWLNSNHRFLMDPNINAFAGRQYNKRLFGFVMDSCPDRWGRLLLNRNENIVARKENRRPNKLNESDYLLGINDETRMGALRYKLELDGEFVSKDSSSVVPPITSIRELEYISLKIENDKSTVLEENLKQLLMPGSSLGGARPKSNVVDQQGELWIAKFPSRNDEYDVGAFEKVAYELANLCGIEVNESKIEKYNNYGSTFLVKRFDRNKNKRIHFASAMTLLNKSDGEVASYLDLVSFIISNCNEVKVQLNQLFRRLVFNIAISNYDDHLRNHGFLLENGMWKLAPMYDINPIYYHDHLSLNINEYDNSADFDLALSTCKYYKLTKEEGKKIIDDICSVVSNNWLTISKKLNINRQDIELLKTSFVSNIEKNK